jgi:RNA polymerase sigma-70 factor (ECF subfamily)
LQKQDTELIEEIKEGSAEAFDQLMQRYQQQVYRIVFGFIKEQDYALDIVQNVFIKVYQNLIKFRGDCQFKTWLMRIAFNESKNWRRGHKQQVSFENFEYFPDNGSNQEEKYVTRELHSLLLRSLDHLNQKYRMVVVLRYFETFSIKDIADMLNCSEGVVKNILFRSLQKLKKILQNSL